MDLLLATLLFAQKPTRNPRDWEMSCQRWHEVRHEVMADKHIDYRSKLNLIRFFKTKVKEPCDGMFV